MSADKFLLVKGCSSNWGGIWLLRWDVCVVHHETLLHNITRWKSRTSHFGQDLDWAVPGDHTDWGHHHSWLPGWTTTISQTTWESQRGGFSYKKVVESACLWLNKGLRALKLHFFFFLILLLFLDPGDPERRDGDGVETQPECSAWRGHSHQDPLPWYWGN